ncbi:MAG TPA: T9SS type A sorting domain-containing protein [Flavobacteriia bacterium]|nr:T9SS type A sorting domain-containing protein [Flavobacteriia bacterium]
MKQRLLLLLIILIATVSSAQNSCETAVPVTFEVLTHVNGIDGNPVLEACTAGNLGSAAEWYQFTPNQDMEVMVTSDLSQNSGDDTNFYIYTGDCANLVCFGGDDDSGSGYLSVATFNVSANETYYLVWDNRWQNNDFDFLVQEYIPIPPPEGVVDFTTQSITDLGRPYGFFDLNGDFLDDLVTTSTTQIDVHYQNSNGSLMHQSITTPTAAYEATWSMAAGDLDGNGYNDLLYGNGSGVSFMIANNDGTAYTEWHNDVYVFSQRSNFVDINNDGNLDAFVCHDVEPSVYYYGDGHGGLEYHKSNENGGLGLADYPTGGNYGSVWIDYDNDHDIDMFIAKCGGSAERSSDQLYRNNGDGTFTEVGAAANLRDSMQTWSSAWADFDNDGDMDVFVGASSGSHKLARNNGDGTFTDVTAGSGYDTFSPTSIENVCFDFNNDGYVDIFGAGSTIMFNNGDMTFTPYSVGFESGAVGDINNDGFLDYFNGDLHINNGNSNNWLKINTIGVQSNHNGIGARIEIESALGTQIRDVKSGVGFRHMSSLNTHFGIADDTSIYRLTVYWPSGNVDQIENPQINSTVQITEGMAPLNIDDNLFRKVSIYPNPVKDKLNINTTEDLSGSLISIFNIKGKRVYNAKFSNNSLSVSKLNSGVYFLRIIKNNKQLKLKFIKE